MIAQMSLGRRIRAVDLGDRDCRPDRSSRAAVNRYCRLNSSGCG